MVGWHHRLNRHAAATAAKSLVESDSVRPHRWQPTRLPRPWDSPGKNTGVGCHFLLQCMKVKSESEVTLSCPTLSDPMDCSLPGSYIHRIFQARVLEWGAIAFSRSNLAHTQISLYTDETCDFSILESRVSLTLRDRVFWILRYLRRMPLSCVDPQAPRLHLS